MHRLITHAAPGTVCACCTRKMHRFNPQAVHVCKLHDARQSALDTLKPATSHMKTCMQLFNQMMTQPCAHAACTPTRAPWMHACLPKFVTESHESMHATMQPTT